MPYIIFSIIVIASVLAAIYTYITGQLIFTNIEGRKYGHFLILLAFLVAAGGFVYYRSRLKPREGNTFTTVHLVVRSGPSYTNGVLGYLYPGQSFHVVSKSGHWAKVAGGKKEKFGYVFADDLQSISRLDAWEQAERKKTLARNDSITAANAGDKDLTIKKNDYEEAKILLQQLHQSHGIKYIDRAHDRAYFDDFLWTRRMSKEQKSNYLEFLSDFLGYIQNNKRKVYIKAINYRTGELFGTYVPGKGSVINK